MKSIYEVELYRDPETEKIKMYIVEKGEQINTLWQTLEQAQQEIGISFGVVLGNDEVISYGKTIGYIKNKHLIQMENEKQKKCDKCQWHTHCVNPRYRKFWDRTKHKCPAFNRMTAKQKLINWFYKIGKG